MCDEFFVTDVMMATPGPFEGLNLTATDSTHLLLGTIEVGLDLEWTVFSHSNFYRPQGCFQTNSVFYLQFQAPECLGHKHQKAMTQNFMMLTVVVNSKATKRS